MIYKNVHYKDIDGHSRYKYQVLVDVISYTGIFGFNIKTKFFHLRTDGILTAFCGYAWDGPSGPTWDTPNLMHGSLVHDIGYQILRDELMLMPENFEYDIEKYNEMFIEWRKTWDILYKKFLIDDGTWVIRAKHQYFWLRMLGRKAALPGFLK